MTSELTEQAKRKVEAERNAYDHAHEQPMFGYVAVIGGYAVFAAGLAGLVGRRREDLPRRVPVVDIALGGLAVHKAARLLAKDAVTSPLRAPFTEFADASGAAEVSEEVRGHGVRHAVGELISCPFCLAPWVAGAYVGGLLGAPRLARSVAAVFAVVGISDVVQQLYGRLKG